MKQLLFSATIYTIINEDLVYIYDLDRAEYNRKNLHTPRFD